MRRRQPMPRQWLMTDERADTVLETALRRLPRGAGVVFRHHATDPAARRARYEAVRRIARARGLVLILAGSRQAAIGWRADGWHDRSGHRTPVGIPLRTASAHSITEIIAAERAGADLIFLSPAFATRSHPGAPSLGPVRFSRMAQVAKPKIVALGGMNRTRYRQLAAMGAWGWAAIDAWSA